MEMLRKLSVGGAFKAPGRLRNTGGQFGVQTAEEWSNMQGESEMSAQIVLELEGASQKKY